MRQETEQVATEKPILQDQSSDFFQGVADRCIEKSKGVVYQDEDTGPVQNFGPYVSGVGKKYADCCFDNFILPHGNEKEKAFIERLKILAVGPESVVLMGGTGCGKTHLAVAMARAKLKAGYSQIITVPELLLKIRASYGPGSQDNEADIVDRYASLYDCLILDDLGAEKTTDFSISTLYLILDRRIRDDRKTIITTNLSLQQIDEKLDARIASRLSAMECFTLTFPDYRKKGRV